MDLTTLSPDEVVYWQLGPVELNATIVWTWAVMLLMVLGSWLVTRRLTTGPDVSRWQTLLEVTVSTVRSQIEEIAGDRPDRYLPFVGTLFLFIAVANVLMLVPGYVPPTASLSTTTGLALAVFVAVPIFGIAGEGVRDYLRHYVEPTPLMLPFNLIGELSRTLALAMRLFGNVLSGTKVVAVLVAVAPLLFPILLRVLGLITGLVQAYIFAVLAIVYIASGERVRRDATEQDATEGT